MLGKTWWHGSIVKRLDSYGPEERGFAQRFDETAWEETQAWERKRWALSKEADALMKRAGDRVKWDGFLLEVNPQGSLPVDEDTAAFLLLAAIILMD